jgi:hypothetical protein
MYDGRMEEFFQGCIGGVRFEASLPRVSKKAIVGAFSFDGRIVAILRLSCFRLVDMLHGYSDERLG